MWRHFNRSWPVADDDPSWRFAGYEPAHWVESGIGLPSSHPSRETCIRASQEQQARLLRVVIERLRASKFSPCGGVLVFQLVDCFPGITAAIVDHARRPKRAYRAVADALQPVLLIADVPEGEIRADGFRLNLPRRRPLRLRLLCVNDDPLRRGQARLRWRITPERAAVLPWWQRVRGRLARRRFRGQEAVELPQSTEPAAILAEPILRFQANGHYRLTAELEVQGETLATLVQRFTVGMTRPVSPRPGDPDADPARVDLAGVPTSIRP